MQPDEDEDSHEGEDSITQKPWTGWLISWPNCDAQNQLEVAQVPMIIGFAVVTAILSSHRFATRNLFDHRETVGLFVVKV